MHVVVIGSGGRESAIRWACRRHGHDVTRADEFDPVEHGLVDLVIVGPESALAAGTADRCAAAGVPCFGPTAALATLETSKGYTRALAAQLEIPSPLFHRSDDYDDAISWWRQAQIPVVVKLDGLAQGKGVIVPNSPAETDEAIRSLLARGPIVLEERLSGPEYSLIAMCDGRVARPLPITQDHKRIFEGDAGPNTGGMGAYGPVSTGYHPDVLTAWFIQPIIDHFAASEGAYVGVLFAGLILTADGPKLLEYNCRFGDPEAQAIIPLLDSDLAEVALACCRGQLESTPIKVRDGAALTVVAAASGYPDEPVLGAPITGLRDEPRTDWLVFEAGTDGANVTGGRVVAVTGVGPDLAAARASAYAGIDCIGFDGKQVRRDIGWRAVASDLQSYAEAGVDIDEGARAVTAMKAAVERTHGPAVLGGLGSFGGAFSAASIKSMDEPVLVASTDGVGTKVELAARLGRYRGVGADIVNHCINDVLVQGARPLFFLDYIASSHVHADRVAEVVTGMADACAASGCALLGGETAEMPGIYADGAFDIAGTLIGLVERRDLLPSPDVRAGDVLIGIASNGPHTNGYSLLRRVFDWLPMDSTPPSFDAPLGDTLLRSHRNYLPVLEKALSLGHVKALAHITGGGLPDNLPRVIPTSCDARVQLGSWPMPPLFALVREVATGMRDAELYRTLNMGIGMVVVCAADAAPSVQASIDETTWIIGSLVPGSGTVQLVP